MSDPARRLISATVVIVNCARTQQFRSANIAFRLGSSATVARFFMLSTSFHVRDAGVIRFGA